MSHRSFWSLNHKKEGGPWVFPDPNEVKKMRKDFDDACSCTNCTCNGEGCKCGETTTPSS